MNNIKLGRLLESAAYASFACFALGASGAARAEGFVGASAGGTDWNASCAGFLSCDKRDTAVTARAGYRFAPWLGVEARYFDLGKARLDSISGYSLPSMTPLIGSVEFRARGVGANAILSWPVTEQWTVSGIAGIARMRTRSSGSFPSVDPVTFTDSATKPYYGVGVDFNVSPVLAVSLEADRYRAPMMGDTVSIDTIGAGLTYRFR